MKTASVFLIFIALGLYKARPEQLSKAEQALELRERAYNSLLAALATNLGRSMASDAFDSVRVCTQTAFKSSAYAGCVLQGLKHESMSNITGNRKRRKRDSSEARNTVRVEVDLLSAMAHHDQELIQSSAGIMDLMTSILRGLKSSTGSWVQNRIPNISKRHIPERRVDISELIRDLFRSPLYRLTDNIHKTVKPIDSRIRRRRSRLLSPRLFPLFDAEVGKETENFLSPDFFSFYDGPNSVGSLVSLLKGEPPWEQQAWLRFIGEATGASDFVRLLSSDSGKGGKGSSAGSEDYLVPVGDTKAGDLYLSLSDFQTEEINNNGYAFLEARQLRALYGTEVLNGDPYFGRYLTEDPAERRRLVVEMVEDIANQGRTERKPRQAPPAIVAPYIGPTVGQYYLLAPEILSPSLFSAVVLGPLVLSPYILSPYIFGPFILSPQVLTPFILNPYVLSPDILNPFVLSPSILSPNVLSPSILSPFVLNPVILSPSAGSPTILSPFVLSPSILSPSTLTATILSPGVLSPSIGSESDGPCILSPCALCKRRKRRSNLKKGESPQVLPTEIPVVAEQSMARYGKTSITGSSSPRSWSQQINDY